MPAATGPSAPSSTVSDVELRVNGEHHALTLDNRTSLLDALREQLDLTGSKKGCDHGQCGACTVLLDVGDIEVSWVDEDDPHLNANGTKGIGELGITGTAAAVANAVHHATGLRLRGLPLHLEDVLQPGYRR